MKNILKLNTILFFALIISLSSCVDDENYAKPEIKNLELGHKNSKKAEAGEDLHIEAKIVADAKISKVQVTIHPEGEHHHEKSAAVEHTEWEVDTVFTEFKGLKNSTFHKHLDVPATAELGDYHFHLIVTDLEGQTTEVKEELTVVESDGEENHHHH